MIIVAFSNPQHLPSAWSAGVRFTGVHMLFARPILSLFGNCGRFAVDGNVDDALQSANVVCEQAGEGD